MAGAARSLIAAPLVALLVGCGTETGTGSTAHELPPEGDRVPITERAVAAIVTGHLPGEPTGLGASFTGDGLQPRGSVGADLRYAGGPGEDGDLLQVVVSPEREESCEIGPTCVELLTDVAGATLLLAWEEGVEDQEPGYVAVLLRRADRETTLVLEAGPFVAGDPRDLDLRFDVDDLVEIVEDPWLRLQTSPEAVEAGDQLDGWSG